MYIAQNWLNMGKQEMTFFLYKQQEQDRKKKNKKKIVIKAERDNDFGDLAAASTGGYDDIYDDDFI